MADLRSIAKELYGLPPGEFVQARKRAAAGVEDKELARQVTALRKPSAAAWAVNALARERPDLVEEVLDLGVELRDAQASSDGSRTRLLDRARRDLTRQALDDAAELTATAGGVLSPAAAASVEETLRAAMTDPDAGDAVQDGLLVATFSASPFEPVDLTDVVAVQADGSRPRARKKTAPRGPTQLERKRLEAAEAKLAKARKAAEAATAELGSRTEQRDELQDELDDLRRRAKELMQEITQTESAIDKADTAVDKAERNERSAQEALDDAQADRDRLG
jgi:hypothetical protein